MYCVIEENDMPETENERTIVVIQVAIVIIDILERCNVPQLPSCYSGVVSLQPFMANNLKACQKASGRC